MTPSRLRYETYRDLYQSERERRDQIRGGVGTPVAALAFSVYSLASVAANFDATRWASVTGLVIMVLAGLAVVTLVAGSVMIVRVEMDFVYLDPPDLRELVAAEKRLRAHHTQDDQGPSEDRVVAQLHDLLAAAYDIAYRRYFAGNEQAARDRTRGLRLLIVALAILSLALAVLPFHGGGGGGS